MVVISLLLLLIAAGVLTLISVFRMFSARLYILITPFPLASTSLSMKSHSVFPILKWASSDKEILPVLEFEQTRLAVFTVSPIKLN